MEGVLEDHDQRGQANALTKEVARLAVKVDGPNRVDALVANDRAVEIVAQQGEEGRAALRDAMSGDHPKRFRVVWQIFHQGEPHSSNKWVKGSLNPRTVELIRHHK